MTQTDIQNVIFKRATYVPMGTSERCASGDECCAPEWFRLTGKRPPSWVISDGDGDGGVFCADCIRAWAITILRLEGK